MASQVKQLLKSTPSIILVGHFCIFDINGNVDALPGGVFYDLEIETILLLEASSSQIIKNLSVRDKKGYTESQILLLQNAEHEKAHEIATSINCKEYLIPAPQNFEFGLKAIAYAGYTFEIPALIKDQPVIHGTYRRIGHKIGRNEPCPCGSGKKYKKCYGR